MKVTLEIPDQDGLSMKFDWTDEYTIISKIEDGQFVLAANKAGLIALAKDLLILAQDVFKPGNDLHYDSYFPFEDNSAEMLIVKI